jgi:hypothetical protein
MTFGDIGACNCSCVALPCDIPDTPLSIAVQYHSHGLLTSTYTATLPIGSVCTWGTCFSGAPLPFLFTITSSGGNWIYTYEFAAAGGGCGGLSTGGIYNTSSGSSCIGIACTYVLTSYTCSPFQLVFTWTNSGSPSTFHVITITP